MLVTVAILIATFRLFFWQSEGRDRVGSRRLRRKRIAGGSHHDILPPILSLVCAGNRTGRRIELIRPQLLARLGVECPETVVIRSANEDQPARRRDRPADSRPPSMLLIRAGYR